MRSGVKPAMRRPSGPSGSSAAAGIRPMSLAARNLDSGPGGLGENALEDGRGGGRLIVGEIHRDLGQARRFEVQAQGLDGWIAAGRLADRPCDPACDRDVIRLQVDVEGDEEFAHANRGGAGAGVQAGAADVGAARGVFERSGRQALEAAPPDVFEALMLGAPGRPAVEVDRDLELAPQALAERVGGLNGPLPGHPFERDEGRHVQGADARMHPGVAPQVDPLHGDAGRGQQGGGNGLGIAGEGEDRAVVIDVGRLVQQMDAENRANRLGERRQHGGVAAFREVRHAFDPTGHSPTRYSTVPRRRTPRAGAWTPAR